ncbi:hypothetical protein GTZ99_11010 [Novosphingobium sp. FSY-8]|uniref:Tetratricopeptide repeat protein n=1 Tax=Novosphingobium ovatum TaxID=1908523 RepID=A0ABW9XEX8_9SPHN|nr:hypothetical protein [Novosphingobium ovatum]NBC37086.1 hypothetical protein [Novosphingobium ovatum]
MGCAVSACVLATPIAQAWAQSAPPVVVAPPAPMATPSPAAAPAAPVKQASLHVRCDGKPPQMSDIESFARIMGALTLLSLFAPAPEQADASKRLFGTAGVEACNQLIDAAAATREKNTLRRLPLILARAAHHIEAKQYQDALADVALARAEAKAAGLTGNPYFDRSMGLSFDRFDSFARLRLGDGEGARAVSLSHLDGMAYSFLPVLTAQDYGWMNDRMDANEERAHAIRGRMLSTAVNLYANRLEDQGRFKDAAALREAWLNRLNSINSESTRSWPLVTAAISHALAGDWDASKARALRARAQLDKLDEEGKPDSERSNVIEALDFLDVLVLHHEGRVDEARRNFAARSQWDVSFGAVVQATDMLRRGARPEQLFGALGKSGDELRQDMRRRAMARMLQTDSNNRTLYTNILPYAQIDAYEKLSRPVWNTDKSRYIAEKPVRNSKFYFMSFPADPTIPVFVRPDALMLHAALLAKAKGFKGFQWGKSNDVEGVALVMFGNAGDADMPAAMYIDADAVIAELRQIIPSPDELAARIKAREATARK